MIRMQNASIRQSYPSSASGPGDLRTKRNARVRTRRFLHRQDKEWPQKIGSKVSHRLLCLNFAALDMLTPSPCSRSWRIVRALHGGGLRDR